MNKLKIGVSNCILKSNTGYNYITFYLKKWFDLVPLCPNINCKENNKDGKYIESLDSWFKDNINKIDELVGIITKSDNSACNYIDIDSKKNGLFISRLLSYRSNIPIESDEGINDPGKRDRFITSIFIFKRWRELEKHSDSILQFHSSHKYLLISFNNNLYNRLNSIARRGKEFYYADLKVKYEKSLIDVLRSLRKRSSIYKALIDIFDIVESSLNKEDRYELLHVIKQYKKEATPLLEPITLLNHYVKSLNIEVLRDQYFIKPTNIELNLLYHA